MFLFSHCTLHQVRFKTRSVFDSSVGFILLRTLRGTGSDTAPTWKVPAVFLLCMDCGFQLKCVILCKHRNESESCLVVSDSVWPHGLYSPWHFPGQNTGVGSLSCLQGIFPTQGSNPGLPHCWWILYQLSHKGSPRMLEWVAFSFSRGSSWPRNQTGVSCITGRFFTNCAIREAQTPECMHIQMSLWRWFLSHRRHADPPHQSHKSQLTTTPIKWQDLLTACTPLISGWLWQTSSILPRQLPMYVGKWAPKATQVTRMWSLNLSAGSHHSTSPKITQKKRGSEVGRQKAEKETAGQMEMFFSRSMGKRKWWSEIYHGLGFLTTREGEWRPPGVTGLPHRVQCASGKWTTQAEAGSLLQQRSPAFGIWSINSVSFFLSHLPAVRPQAN